MQNTQNYRMIKDEQNEQKDENNVPNFGIFEITKW